MTEEDYSHLGMDPATKRYFKKIIGSISWSLLWMFFGVTVGLYMRFALPQYGLRWFHVTFYVLDLLLFFLLLRYLYRTWSRH